MFGHITSDEAAASDDDPQGNGYLQYANGVQGFVRTMPCGAADWDIEVIGTKGRLRSLNNGEQVEFWKLVPSSLDGREVEPAQHIFPLPTSNENANVRCVRDLIVCIETGKEPNCSGEDGRHALEIALALRESHRRGGTRGGAAAGGTARCTSARWRRCTVTSRPSCAAPVPQPRPRRRRPRPARRAALAPPTCGIVGATPAGSAMVR